MHTRCFRRGQALTGAPGILPNTLQAATNLCSHAPNAMPLTCLLCRRFPPSSCHHCPVWLSPRCSGSGTPAFRSWTRTGASPNTKLVDPAWTLSRRAVSRLSECQHVHELSSPLHVQAGPLVVPFFLARCVPSPPAEPSLHRRIPLLLTKP